jgi:hypothetical protein
MKNIKNNLNNYQINEWSKERIFTFDWTSYDFDLSDNAQSEIKFKELKLENERNKQIFIERIEQLQNEIDLLIKEKNSK